MMHAGDFSGCRGDVGLGIDVNDRVAFAADSFLNESDALDISGIARRRACARLLKIAAMASAVSTVGVLFHAAACKCENTIDHAIRVPPPDYFIFVIAREGDAASDFV